jgi:hypothetical protein
VTLSWQTRQYIRPRTASLSQPPLRNPWHIPRERASSAFSFAYKVNIKSKKEESQYSPRYPHQLPSGWDFAAVGVVCHWKYWLDCEWGWPWHFYWINDSFY